MGLDVLEKYQSPLQLVDKILKNSENKVTVQKMVSSNEEYFQGHFPENPLMPGVLLVQTMIEACQLLSESPIHLSKMSKVKFRKMVKPGASLLVKVERKESQSLKFSGKVMLEDKVACSAELEFLE